MDFSSPEWEALHSAIVYLVKNEFIHKYSGVTKENMFLFNK